MTIGELRDKIEALPDDMEVVVIGHFGEAIRKSPYTFRVVDRQPLPIHDTWEDYNGTTDEYVEVFEIANTDLGEEPD